MIFRRDSKRLEELEALILQYRELLGKLRDENEYLRNMVDDVERRLESVLKIFFPELYHLRRPRSLGEMITVLVDGLDLWRRRVVTSEAPRKSDIREVKEHSIVDADRIRARIKRLSGDELEVLRHVLMGYCTVNAVHEELNISRRKADLILNNLVRQGLLDVLKVKTPRNKKGYDVFFPSPHGEVASEVLLNKPWSLLHAEVLKQNNLYIDNEKLIREAEVRLKHAGYRVVTELDDPSECTFKYSGGSHRADLVVIDDIKVFIECESMSNPINQAGKMLDAYYEQFKRIHIIVSSGLARRMMVQRICYWAWRRREPEGFIFEARVEAIDRITRISNMPKYIVIRPSVE